MFQLVNDMTGQLIVTKVLNFVSIFLFIKELKSDWYFWIIIIVSFFYFIRFPRRAFEGWRVPAFVSIFTAISFVVDFKEAFKCFKESIGNKNVEFYNRKSYMSKVWLL